ncbi:MAG: TonB-dependent receptor, partial [Woeseia sp.]
SLLLRRVLVALAGRRCAQRATIEPVPDSLKPLLSLILVLSLIGGPAFGQDAGAIEEIQVTATRRPQATAQVPAAITVIPADDIAGEKLATDALASQLGVFVQQTTAGQGAAIIRGLKGSEVLHVVDGMRMNNAIFRNAPTQYLALVAPGSIERIEVLRGSPGSVYGSDAVGGVVHVISRLPRFETDQTAVRTELAVAADSAELGQSLRLGVDFGNRRLAGLVGAGWQAAGNRRTGGGRRIGPSAFESSSLRLAMAARPDDDQSWIVDLQSVRQPSTPRIDEMLPGFGQSVPASSEFFFEPNERHAARLRYGQRDGLWSADWTLDLGWQRIVDDRRIRGFQADERLLEQNRSDLFGVAMTAAVESGQFAWLLGTEFYHDTVRSARTSESIGTGLLSDVQPRFPDNSRVEQAAVFANVSWPVHDRHAMSAGVRGSSVDIELPAVIDTPASQIHIDDWSADLGWLFDVTATLQLAANAGHGFRAPNIFDIGALGQRPGNRYNVPNRALKSEQVTHYDLGLRRQSDHTSFEVVAWQLRYSDRIQSVATGELTPDGREVVQSRNLGDARIHGLEVGARWSPPGAISAELVVNYTRGQQRALDGAPEPGDRIPPVNGKLSVDWQARAVLRLEMSLTYAAAQNRLSVRDAGDPRIDPNGTAGWLAANAGAVWQPGETWRIGVGVDNILDQRYRVHGSGLDAPGRNLYLHARAIWQ